MHQNCAHAEKKVFEENFVYKLITGRIRLVFKIPSKDLLYKTRTRILYDHKNVPGFSIEYYILIYCEYLTVE